MLVVGYVLLVMTAMMMVAAQASYHIIGWFSNGVDSGVYDHRLDKTFEEYEDSLGLYISKAVFYMWIVNYAVQIIWLLYALELSVRQTDNFQFLCERPAVMPASVFIFFMLGLGANAGWLALFDLRDEWKYAPLALLASAVFLHISLGVSLTKLKKYEYFMYSRKLTEDVWLIRVFVQNGLGLYAACNMLVLFYNLLMEGEHYDIIDADKCVYAFVGIVMGYVIVWFVVDSFLARDSMRGLITPYAVCIFALAMVVYHQKDDDSSTKFYVSVVSLAFAGIMSLIALSIAIGWRKPTLPGSENEK